MTKPASEEEQALDRAKKALRLATAALPHLSGLARLVRIKVTPSVAVAGIGRSGLLVLNPTVFSTAPVGDAAFVLAHELLHLALDTHNRQGETDKLIVNFAHDYIINDMLMEEMERNVPLDGLCMVGAREKSLEQLVVELSQNADGEPDLHCWSPEGTGRKRKPPPPPPSPLSRALENAGLLPPPPPPPALPQLPNRLVRGDLLPDEGEDAIEPELSRRAREQLRAEVRKAAVKAASLSQLRDRMNQAGMAVDLGEPQRGAAMIEALHAAYDTPWEAALQRWFDAVGPGERTYARPSRRAGDRTDIVLPGRRREGWTLHVLLDTSGSMADEIPKALGAIAWFCEASSVAEVHVVQCDVEVTDDRWIEPRDLGEYRVAGFGSSDMTPGMEHLAIDPEVEAAIVVTDGFIDYPKESPPYSVLWCLLGDIDSSFSPPYGQTVVMR